MILPNDILIRATSDGQTVWVSQRMVCEACGIDEDYFEKAGRPRYKSSLSPSWRKVADKQIPKPVPTDAEVEQAIKARFAQSRKILDIREEYYNEFRKFLSPKQIQKMYNMEKHNGDKFRKEMKKRQGMKKQHDGRRHMSQGDVKK